MPRRPTIVPRQLAQHGKQLERLESYETSVSAQAFVRATRTIVRLASRHEAAYLEHRREVAS